MDNGQKGSDKIESNSNISDDAFFLNRDISVGGEITLKERVRILLLRIGKSQNWLADKIEINKGTMSKILNGHWQPTSQVKINMAKCLECDTIVLFGATPYWLDYQKSFKEVKNE